MKTCLTRRGLLAALGAAALPLRANTAPLRLGLSPYLSPAALLTAFRPLREHLEATLKRPVETLSAKDFRSLAEATQRGDYDVVQLPAHLARLAMVDWAFEGVAAPTEPVTVVVVVKGNGAVRSPEDLKGRSVGMMDPLSLTATIGRRWLQEHGLSTATQVMALPSTNSGMFALDRGDVAAFVMADTQLSSLPPATPRGETVLARIAGIPGPLYVARPGWPADELTALRKAMWAFVPVKGLPPTTANSPLSELEPARLARLDPLVAIARQALNTPR